MTSPRAVRLTDENSRMRDEKKSEKIELTQKKSYEKKRIVFKLLYQSDIL